MRKIYKYTLHEHGKSLLPLPVGAKILHVADQQGAVQLWAEVPPGERLESRTFHVAYTGGEAPDGAYIGTAITPGGNIVRHVYEVKG